MKATINKQKYDTDKAILIAERFITQPLRRPDDTVIETLYRTCEDNYFLLRFSSRKKIVPLTFEQACDWLDGYEFWPEKIEQLQIDNLNLHDCDQEMLKDCSCLFFGDVEPPVFFRNDGLGKAEKRALFNAFIRQRSGNKFCKIIAQSGNIYFVNSEQ